MPKKSVWIIKAQICYLSGLAQNQCLLNPHIFKLEIPIIQIVDWIVKSTDSHNHDVSHM